MCEPLPPSSLEASEELTILSRDDPIFNESYNSTVSLIQYDMQIATVNAVSGLLQHVHSLLLIDILSYTPLSNPSLSAIQSFLIKQFIDFRVIYFVFKSCSQNSWYTEPNLTDPSLQLHKQSSFYRLSS